MENSVDLPFDPNWPISSQVKTIIDTRAKLSKQWWEQIRHDQNGLMAASRFLGAGFFDSLAVESRSTLETELCMLLGQYRARIGQRLDSVRQQIDKLIYDYKAGCPVDFTAERYNLKGEARVYRSVLAGMTCLQDLVMWTIRTINVNTTVLDVACGTGQIGHTIFGQRACRRVNVDLSIGMLNDGRRSGYLEGALPCVARAESLPLISDSIDLGLLIFGIDTVQRPRRVLFELSRVLSTTGQLILVTPLPLRSASDRVEIVPDYERIGQGQDWLEDATVLTHYLKLLGLTIVRWGVTTYYHSDIRGLKQSAAFVFVIQHSSIFF